MDNQEVQLERTVLEKLAKAGVTLNVARANPSDIAINVGIYNQSRYTEPSRFVLWPNTGRVVEINYDRPLKEQEPVVRKHHSDYGIWGYSRIELSDGTEYWIYQNQTTVKPIGSVTKSDYQKLIAPYLEQQKGQ